MDNNARIYMPFNALSGFNEALLEVGRERVAKKELFDDRINTIENIIRQLKISDLIKVTYYNKDNYKIIKGHIFKLEINKKYLVVNKTKINFKDIYDIDIIDIL